MLQAYSSGVFKKAICNAISRRNVAHQIPKLNLAQFVRSVIQEKQKQEKSKATPKVIEVKAIYYNI